MAIVVKHAFTSPVADAGNPTEVGPSEWNADHTVTGVPGAVQMVSTQTGAVLTTTTAIPLDDTIPQITEGAEFMTVSITPKSATNKLVVNVVIVTACSTGSGLILALFQDATANALAATTDAWVAAAVSTTTSLNHSMTAGTTSATTFRVRAGMDRAGTLTVNGINATRQLGGVMASSLIVTEFAP